MASDEAGMSTRCCGIAEAGVTSRGPLHYTLTSEQTLKDDRREKGVPGRGNCVCKGLTGEL